MRVQVNVSALKRTRWYEYLIRFLIGGSVTVLAALVARRFGAGIGGLFLAFPAIFPATATLIASHEKRRNGAGKSGTRRAREKAGADAVGASMGAFGLVAFAAIVWWAIAGYSTFLVLSVATLAYGVVSFAIWQGRNTVWRRLAARFSGARIRHCGNGSAPVHRRSPHE